MGRHGKSHGREHKEIIKSIPVYKHKGKKVLGEDERGRKGTCEFLSPRILNARCATKVFGVTLEHLMNFI